MPNRTNSAAARKLKRQQQALNLRRAGLSFAEIALKVGAGKSTVHRLVQLGMAASREQIKESGDELRAIEISRLDGMLAKHYPAATKGDIAAANLVLKIGERRARLLGLDAPVRTALEGTEGAPPIATEATVTFYMPDNGRG